MLELFRWLIRIVTGLIVMAVLAVVIAYWFLSRSLIDYDEDFTVAGISAPVDIVRNNDNVPHIFGKTDADVFYALGFVHAQDRLWQMTMLRPGPLAVTLAALVAVFLMMPLIAVIPVSPGTRARMRGSQSGKKPNDGSFSP